MELPSPRMLMSYQTKEKASTMEYFSRGCWTTDEDCMLKLLVSTIGTGSWLQISQSMGTRTAKQCRERYYNFVKPDLNHGPITQDEARTIVIMVAQIGRRWAHISKCLKNRSDNAVKNWWYGYVHRQSTINRKTARLELERQKLGNTVWETTTRPIKNTTTQSTHLQVTEGRQCYRNRLSDQVRLEDHARQEPIIENLHHTSPSTSLLNPSNRTLPPITGLQVEKKPDQFEIEVKSSLRRTQRPSFQHTPPIQQGSPIPYTSPLQQPSPIQHTSPLYARNPSPLFCPPSMMVTPPSQVQDSMPGIRIYSGMVNKEPSYQSMQYRQRSDFWSPHSARQYVLSQEYVRSRDDLHAALAGLGYVS